MDRRQFVIGSGALAGLSAVGWPRLANAQAAQKAVEAAQAFRGSEVTVVWEAGLQALDPLNFSGPMWEEATGIKVNIVEVPTSEMFTKILQEHRAGTGAYDALNVVPAWMPDLVRAGALEPLDSYVEKYGYGPELETIAPVYRDNQMKVDGTIYGLPDDGDVLVLYYRTDVLNDPALQSEFKAEMGYDLPVPPTTWKEFDDVGAFITEWSDGKIYGAGFMRESTYGALMFQERFRNEGGRFFDPDTMKATINSDVGVKVFTDWVAENKWMPKGVQTWGFVENLAAFLAGDTAMTVSWPPYGRWAAGYGTDTEALSWVPKSTIGGKVGYAMTPGGHPQLALGFALGVSSSSRNKEAAYLFCQWLNSAEISLQRVQLPYALRDPFRDSHFASEEYKSRWPEAPQYLQALQDGAVNGLLDLSIIQTDRYEEVIRQSVTRLWSGEDPKAILDDAAAQWDSLTERIGLEKQKAAYASWASNPAAYPA
ncbi:ABC transporter substrate-binding protein [Acuticoccus yangtzensis]|uniref:ABC transporter substrate-binding protein n=1 Tax=Acuticoccus yangtzensis TaxID=1443441 RepID=UPI0009495309|nr:sugar ABC transporter substrate-binding protein [Acuticoccus yangtzensis]ORE95497.1 extracellular solute-binding protein family 1 [Stappia sp. 22II-S9-Z10]